MTEENDNFPRCSCGKYVRIYSTLLGQGFCSEEHYAVARGECRPTPAKHQYAGHGNYLSSNSFEEETE